MGQTRAYGGVSLTPFYSPQPFCQAAYAWIEQQRLHMPDYAVVSMTRQVDAYIPLWLAGNEEV